MRQLDDYILVLENAMPDSLANSCIELAEQARVWKAGGVEDQAHTARRRVHTANLKTISMELDNTMYPYVNNVLREYIARVPTAIKCGVAYDTQYEILKYQTGDEYKEHVDASSTYSRILSCSFSLNDGYSGGEWSFFDGSYVVNVPKNAAIIFPSGFLFPHAITPITEGTRYSLITWFM